MTKRGFSIDYGADPKDPNYAKIGNFEDRNDGKYQWQVRNKKVVLVKVQNNISGPLPVMTSCGGRHTTLRRGCE
ncbi:MAG: hypothetical protein UU12_C0002G0001 [Candidatus Woesebacteria bacterium GW2011_GWA2_40_7b]|uniref:Uncharacterized protein n=1 Tax=Candidatus Woesebacteria bacterium GW2011_GWA2_40_7b TaxID=1618563 RepID=A0A0G0T2R5_9BACT|nr:MAG: hypothetical protein UU12_C0002G0001 [Candidatus Woesebacteria bacterium GW2011_GWA2_40_7b]